MTLISIAPRISTAHSPNYDSSVSIQTSSCVCVCVCAHVFVNVLLVCVQQCVCACSSEPCHILVYHLLPVDSVDFSVIVSLCTSLQHNKALTLSALCLQNKFLSLKQYLIYKTCSVGQQINIFMECFTSFFISLH